MGAAASMEDESNNSGGPSRATSARPASKHLPQSALSSRPGSTHSGESKLPTPPAGQSRPGSRASSRQSWKSAFQTTGYQSANARKIRAAALGRKSAYTVTIDKNGFSVQKLHLCEGQVVTFVWNDAEGSGFNITQVVHDGDQYRPVVGGYNSGPVTVKGFFEQQFNIEGEYKFVSAGIRCTPLAVSVDPRMPIEAEITDKGFFPKIIRLDEGNSVNWTWEDCAVPHSIYEVRYCPQTGGLVRPESQNQMVATKTGNHLYEFLKPGLTYFQTEGSHAGILHSCVIHVRERQREFKVHVHDRSFDPPIMVVEEGDRIWWQWDRENCKKPHCIYQIEPPPLNHPHDESYKPVKNGFKWPAPSKNGLMSYEFNDPGIFYYSDHNFNEAAEYIGTIIVKPKQKEHFVELSPDGFSPDLIYAETGDRVWWTWNINDMDPSFTINEVDRCVSPLGARPGLDVMPQGEKSYMDEETMEVMVQVGLSTIQLGHIGVYHYRVADSPHSITTSSIIVNPGPRNHTVHVTDSGFNPKVLTIHPRDRVWFVWQQGSKQHNIVQVSHQGSNIKGGFCSGCPMDAPSAYLHQFKDPGVYYYISSNLPKSFGAIVVSSQPQVHEVQVTATGLVPDPVPININDVVAWTFRGLRHNDVMQVDSVDQILDAQFNSPTIQPRRCLNRLFQVKGVVHFASKSFMKQSKKDNRAGDENRVSSVIVDDSSDSALVRVDSTGFHPSTVTIDKGHSVLWTWKESGDESHNIVHVNPPDSDVPLSVIQGSKSFNSGRPVANNSFLYTFDEPGIHCVASQGAPGYAGTIHVLNQGERTEMPYIISEVNGGSVEKHTVVKMATESKDAKIYYTIDGNAPEMHKMAPKIYKKDKGIILKNSGLCFVRAMAVSPGKLNSEVFTSKRFWVLSGDDRGATSSDDGEMIDDGNKHLKMQEWRNAVPIIKGCLTEPGVMEIFWEPPPSEALKHVRGYQVFLNGVSYCDLFPPSHNSVNIAGLAGGRLYEVHLEVYPHDAMYLPHKSNQLVMKVPLTTSTGGPVVSLEVTQQQDALAIVWMSIATHENPMQGYRVYLNGQLCGNMVVPDEKSDRCKVVIEGCQLNLVYRVVVMAIPEGNGKPKMSNELEVSLPLETENIVLPPHDARVDDDDVYKEYVEIREGTGYLPQMDQGGHGTSTNHPSYPLATIDLTKPDALSATRPLPSPKMSPHPSSIKTQSGRQSMHSLAAINGYVQNSTHSSTTVLQAAGGHIGQNGAVPHGQYSMHPMPPQGGQQQGYYGGMAPDQHGGQYSQMSLPTMHEEHSRRSGHRRSEDYDESSDEERTTQANGAQYMTAPGSMPPQFDEKEESQAESGMDSDEGGDEAGYAPNQHQSSYGVQDQPSDRQAGLVDRSGQGLVDRSGQAAYQQWPQSPKIDEMVTSKPPSRNNSAQSMRSKPQGKHYRFQADPGPSPLPSRPSSRSNSGSQLPPQAKSHHMQAPPAPEEQRDHYGGQTGYYTNTMPPYQGHYPPPGQYPDQPRQYSSQPSQFQTLSGQYPASLGPYASSSGQYSNTVAQFANPSGQYEAYPGQYQAQPGQYPAGAGQYLGQQLPLPETSPNHPYNQHSLEPMPKKSGFTRPPPETAPNTFVEIDATLGPWVNKMKTWTDANKALVRMGLKPQTQENAEAEEATKPAREQPQYEVEVEEDTDTDTKEELVKDKKKKKKKHKNLVVEVEETAADLSMQDTRQMAEHQGAAPGSAVVVSSAVPVLGSHDGQEHLPAPIVTAQNAGDDTVLVTWDLPRNPEPLYRLLVFSVNVIGLRFKKQINSDISFECLQDSGTETISAIQQVWNVTKGMQCEVRGLMPGMKYKIFVVATYTLVNRQQPCEIQASSAPIIYTTMGPPPAPTLRPVSADLYRVMLGWDPLDTHADVRVSGYRVIVDGKQLGEDLTSNYIQTSIDNLTPGKTIKVQVEALTSHPVGDSEPSNAIRVTCPQRPPAPNIVQQPSYKKGSVIVAWEKPSTYGTSAEDIIFYRIFLDGKLHGEVKSNSTCNKNGYQYYLTDLDPGQSYDVSVRVYAGQRKVDPTAEHVYCLSESVDSNSVPVMCPAPPTSPCLRLDGMHAEGIDVTWEMPQQYGDAAVSGYQMLREGRLYGSIIPPDVHSLRIKDIQLGDILKLQILALTDHPVGRHEKKSDSPVEGVDSGIDGSHPDDRGFSEIFIGDRYSACKPGPKLVVHYTGLVQPPAKVWVEHVTGHSAMIVWSITDKPKAHFVQPESYQVTWWPGDKADNDINSQSTNTDHLTITGLKSNTVYSVVVEARKMQRYTDMEENTDGVPEDAYQSSFILTGQSEHVTLRTAGHPDAPTNLGVVTTTCHSIQVSWDPPQDRGVDIIALRVDAIAMQAGNETRRHAMVEVVPDCTTTVVNNLSEKTEYLISVTAITEEFFDQLPEENLVKKSRQLPKNKPPEESPWLPSSSVLISTSGTDPPADVTIADTKVNAVKIQWKPAVVHGSNRLQGHVVRWVEARHTRHGIPADETELTHHRTLVAEDNEMVIEDLAPGILYKIVVEAVVSVKTTIELGHRDPQVEKRNRRTTHVLSVPVYVRTRAPCEPPYPIITAYTPTTIQLYWEKPLLWSIIGKDDNDNPKYLKLSLEGYRLEINGKPHMRLAPNAQSCTLIKCKPGRTYQIVLIAMTCTESVKKDRKKKMRGTIHGNTTLSSSLSSLGTSKTWEPLSEDDENDETASKPLVVSLPRENDGYIKDLSAYYEFSKSGQEQDLGDIHVDWTVHSTGANIGQYNIISHCLGDGIIQTKCADADIRNSVLPVKMRKCLYNIQLEPKYNTDVVPSEPQMVQALIPGSPEAPEIWTRSVGRDEFVIEWGEPRLYVVKIRGYQVYLNGKKVGNMLSSSHRKAVIPCKPRKGYKVSLVALSADPNYPDSEQSNVLLINSGGSGDTVTFEDDPPYRLHDDGSDLPVTVVEVTDTTIHMEWKTYLASDEVAFYKVQWSSVAQPSEREVQLNATERSCILHNCFPGTNHFIRVMSVNVHSQVLDRSRQLTIQTSASPDPPVVTVRACNFRYIAIQWEKPSQYGDAKVTGYKVYVNGVVEAILGSEQFTYSFTQGKWCREYAFQVQALATVDKLNSRPSDPLIVMWPGVQPPILRRAPAVSGNSLKVLWDTPNTTEGVKIKQYKVIAREQESDRVVQVISPIHPDTTEAELHNLKQGTYLVHVEVLVHGSDEAVRSEAIRICPTLNPDPPYITVTVVGLEERRQIEKVSCDLINRRDRLLSIINRGASSPRHTSDEKVHMATENLAQVEAMLDDCLAALKHYTGHLLAHVSWTCPQSNPDMHVTGYKVLVDGKQYGTTLHAGIKNVRIKLGLNKPSHRLSMVSVCDRPHNVSLESNVVELLTEPFHPFNFFNFLDSSRKDFSISYEEALKQEKKQSSKKLLNSGLQKRHVPPPSCTVLDLFEAEYHPLFPPSGPRRPTILLFWASWSLASMRALTWFVRFARDYKADYDFISIACTDGDATAAEKQGLVRVVSENGWRDDSCIRHCTSHSVASYTISNDTKEYLNKTATKEGAVDITELFGVTGVPTIVIVHPEDYIAWKGRYCAFDFASFENFMRYSLSEVMDEHPTAYNPWDTDVDVKVLDVAKKKQMNESQMLIHRGGSMHTGTNSTIIHAPTYPTMNGHARPHSAKRLFTKTHKNKNKDKISVNIRPYSANSPYEQRFMATLPVKQSRKARSGRKLHKYTM